MLLAPSPPAHHRFRPRRPRASSPVLFLVQPILNRIARTVTHELPGLFARLGPYSQSRFLIDAREMPFLLLLRPDPSRPSLAAWPRIAEPQCDARISGSFRDLLGLIDGGRDGDALFFSRNLDITGNLEAVVCLRNAIDDVDGAVADRVASALGPAGRIAWTLLLRHHRRSRSGDSQ